MVIGGDLLKLLGPRIEESFDGRPLSAPPVSGGVTLSALDRPTARS
jgi:hypothetical protein